MVRNGIGRPEAVTAEDLLEGFLDPPKGFGTVPFYWWQGDPLTKERLSWQLDQLSVMRPSGLQVNYAHSNKGGYSYGLTMPSEPPLFSGEWWSLFKWWAGECGKRGISVSLSDYTLGIVGQGYWMDEILRDHPDMAGMLLEADVREVSPGESVAYAVPGEPLCCIAVPGNGDGNHGPFDLSRAIDLSHCITDGTLAWSFDGSLPCTLITMYPRVVPTSVNPLDPRLGPEVADRFFGAFERALPGEGGQGLNFFFSDELTFGVGGNLWHPDFPAEFEKRRGYDIKPLLPAILVDAGEVSHKVRMDYYDTIVELSEDAYFKPVYEWHESRGMVYGCDHGGRGRDVTEFGDYFRTQRWMSGPGCDQPQLQSDIIKNKVASSIAHLYHRPRVWLEGFHSSGWGTTSGEFVQATLRNYAMGHNLLSPHGLYYSLHGGWWEWAPPCNHFRMPYWSSMQGFYVGLERLSYILSQGSHACDFAILYPVAHVHAGYGDSAVRNAFSIGEKLYGDCLDFDFIDEESICRGSVEDGRLSVSGEGYRCIIIPGAKALHHDTVVKLLELHDAGCRILSIGAIATTQMGVDDGDLLRLNEALKGSGRSHSGTGDLLESVVRGHTRDFEPEAGSRPAHMHRVVGDLHLYMVHGADQGSRCFFRAHGRVELWDTMTGAITELPADGVTDQGTFVRMPLADGQAQILAFRGGDPGFTIPAHEPYPSRSTADSVIDPGGLWETEFIPTRDNTWGDFRLPASPGFIGPEAQNFKYMRGSQGMPSEWVAKDFDDSGWADATYSYGTRMWILGPVDDTDGPEDELLRISGGAGVEALAAVTGAEWRPYAFSWRYGVQGRPGAQGYHGLKGNVSGDFISLGEVRDAILWDNHIGDPGKVHYLWTSLYMRDEGMVRFEHGGLEPVSTYVDGIGLASLDDGIRLSSGYHSLLLKYVGVGRGHVVPITDTHTDVSDADDPLSMPWAKVSGLVPMEAYPGSGNGFGYYRFLGPPGMRSMTVTVHGEPEVWVDGEPASVETLHQDIGDAKSYTATPAREFPGPAVIAIRIRLQPGHDGGSALPVPITFRTRKGLLELGDWSLSGCLSNYSGGLSYSRNFHIPEVGGGRRFLIDLGKVVSSAEVAVNGAYVGSLVAPPWRLDITEHVGSGDNRISITVFNTLSNHYLNIPTDYRGSLESGLIGPVAVSAFRKQTPSHQDL